MLPREGSVSGDGESDPAVQVQRDPVSGIQYVQHTRSGSEGVRRGEAEWRFLWKAPREPEGPVVMHLAAVAANDDASEFGDRVYADSVVVGPRD